MKILKNLIVPLLIALVFITIAVMASNVLTLWSADAVYSKDDGIKTYTGTGYLVSTDTLISKDITPVYVKPVFDFWYKLSTPDTACATIALQYKDWSGAWHAKETYMTADSTYTWEVIRDTLLCYPVAFRILVIGHAQNGPHTTVNYKLRFESQ